MKTNQTGPACTDAGCAATPTLGEEPTLACKLTSVALRERKETVLASLKKQVLVRQELPTGFAFQFRDSDALVDELAEFVKTERQCCDFFAFDLSFGKEGGTAWLKLTGPTGAKEFITNELGL